MRLAKYLSRSGVASRRHSEQLISSGRVEVDGRRVTDPARDVDERNRVRIDGRNVAPDPLEHYALNKPAGVVSTAHDPKGRPKVTDLVPSPRRLYPVGRLDADSTGLIILTNDGDLAHRLMHPSFEIGKTYRATVAGEVDDRTLGRLRSGVQLEDGPTAPALVELIERTRRATVLDLTIHEGRKRQVRRMCEVVGHEVLELERTRVGPLELGSLPHGDARPLTGAEVDALRASVAGGDQA